MTRPAFLDDIRLLVWDLDGTLYPSPRGLGEAIHQRIISVVAQHLHLSLEQAEQKYSQKLNELHSNTMSLEALGIPGQATFSRLWDGITWSEFIFPNPELVLAIRECALPQAILTNSNERRHIDKKLEAVGLSAALFTPIVSSAETGFKKPDPNAFRAVLDLVPFAPEEVLYIGDRVDVDVVGAQAVGMRACLVGSTDPRAEICVPSSVELLRLL